MKSTITLALLLLSLQSQADSPDTMRERLANECRRGFQDSCRALLTISESDYLRQEPQRYQQRQMIWICREYSNGTYCGWEQR